MEEELSQKKKREAKKDTLELATQNLINEVAILTDVVETNNRTIGQLLHEINSKPDDAEIQFITGMAQIQRRRHLQFAIVTSIVSAVLSGAVAFAVANNRSQIRCENLANQNETLTVLFSKVDINKKYKPIQDAIAELNRNKVKC